MIVKLIGLAAFILGFSGGINIICQFIDGSMTFDQWVWKIVVWFVITILLFIAGFVIMILSEELERATSKR